MKVQDLIKKENGHQTSPYPKPRVRKSHLRTIESKGGSIGGGQHGLGQDDDGPNHDCTGKICPEA
eukprot:11209341-Prorocentrum_lima.AAC.1